VRKAELKEGRRTQSEKQRPWGKNTKKPSPNLSVFTKKIKKEEKETEKIDLKYCRKKLGD